MNKTVFSIVSAAAIGAIIWGCRCVPEPSPESVPAVPQSAESAPSETASPTLVAKPEPAVAEQKPRLTPPPPPRRLKPRAYDGRISQRLGDTLPRVHVSQSRLDDEISRRAWTNLVTYYDFDHSVFLKSDLDALAARDRRLDDEIRAGDASFGYDVYNLYVERLRERIDFATNLVLATKWDFSTNETYRARRKDAPWPESREAAEEYWRKRIKNEVLVAKINRDLDKATNEVDIAADIVKKYRQYVTVLTEPDEEAVMQHYLSAVARAYDPHSDYMSPATKEDFDMEMNLTLCGVGAVLTMDDGALKIAEVMPGGPMDVDGRIKEGDKIIGVKQGDGELEDIMWRPMHKSIKKIRGKKGTRVTLEIIPRSDPSGASRKLIELVRDEIRLEDQAATGRVDTVTLNGVTNKIGYVYLPGFYGTMDKKPFEEGYCSSALDVAQIIAGFNSEDVKGLVLDLRGNGGGSLREAVFLSALFVPSGPVVQIRDVRTVGCLPIPAGNPVAFKRPMVVLTDRASASASEIVAGHLQDVGRAIVVGDSRTHGKGTVQTVMGLGPEKYGSCKITTARFYRVDGRSTQLEGVAADIRLPSLLDSLDIGEDKLTYALPFTRIASADYSRAWNMQSYVPKLKELSDARLANDERYRKHIANVDGVKAISDREVVSLEYEERKAQMKADRELRELDDDDDGDSQKSKKRGRRRRNERDGEDVVLDEANFILMDLIRLVGDEELPLPKVWWF
ncbi:MAG: carboxy terminal-processing peptidase [Kiritimatiellae bacterium]|nr:carboxy terminal-processing peptidase [Kiritimatiellia bacterium]